MTTWRYFKPWINSYFFITRKIVAITEIQFPKILIFFSSKFCILLYFSPLYPGSIPVVIILAQKICNQFFRLSRVCVCRLILYYMWTEACQTALSVSQMGILEWVAIFYYRIFPHGIRPASLASPALADNSLLATTWEIPMYGTMIIKILKK